jgi:hypothetical protein
MAIFDDILNGVAAEDRAILAKYPALKTSVETLETQRNEAARYASTWVNWHNENWDPETNTTKRERELAAALADATTRLSSAAGAGADESTLAILRKELADTRKLVEDSQAKSLQSIEGLHNFYGTIQSRMFAHKEEFGENLDGNAVMTYMTQNGIKDPVVAYERMFAGRRAELATQRTKDLEAKHLADIEAAEKRGRELAAREAAMGPGGSLPTDNSGGIAGVTGMGKPAEVPDALKTAMKDAKVGDGSLAALGYQAYLRGDLPGMQQ